MTFSAAPRVAEHAPHTAFVRKRLTTLAARRFRPSISQEVSHVPRPRPRPTSSSPATNWCRSSSSKPRPRSRRRPASSGACRGPPAGPVVPGFRRLQRAEGRRVRARLRRARPGQGRDPRPPAASRTVRRATASCRTTGSSRSSCRSPAQHLPAFEPQGLRLRDELRQKMTAHARQFDPDEADWIGRRARASHARRSARSPTPRAARSCRCRCSAN